MTELLLRTVSGTKKLLVLCARNYSYCSDMVWAGTAVTCLFLRRTKLGYCCTKHVIGTTFPQLPEARKYLKAYADRERAEGNCRSHCTVYFNNVLKWQLLLRRPPLSLAVRPNPCGRLASSCAPAPARRSRSPNPGGRSPAGGSSRGSRPAAALCSSALRRHNAVPSRSGPEMKIKEGKVKRRRIRKINMRKEDEEKDWQEEEGEKKETVRM